MVQGAEQRPEISTELRRHMKSAVYGAKVGLFLILGYFPQKRLDITSTPSEAIIQRALEISKRGREPGSSPS